MIFGKGIFQEGCPVGMKCIQDYKKKTLANLFSRRDQKLSQDVTYLGKLRGGVSSKQIYLNRVKYPRESSWVGLKYHYHIG